MAFHLSRFLLPRARTFLVSSSALPNPANMPIAFRTMIHSSSKALLPARVKLQQVLEEYRAKNYGQPLFPRFVKEMIAAADINHDGKISHAELSRLLQNIGAAEHLSSEDLRTLFDEYGRMDDDANEMLIDIHDVHELLLSGDHHLQPRAAA